MFNNKVKFYIHLPYNYMFMYKIIVFSFASLISLSKLHAFEICLKY